MRNSLFFLLIGAVLMIYGWWETHHDSSKDWWQVGSPSMKAFSSSVFGAIALVIGGGFVIAGAVGLLKALF